MRSPRSSSSWRRSTSTPVACAISTVVLALRRSMLRIGIAHSLGRQRAARHLVEQRLEEVVVHAVHQRHLDIRVAQRVGRRHTAEATAHDRHPSAPWSLALRRLLLHL